MRILTFIFITLISAQIVFAGEGNEEKKDTLWTPKGVVGVNLSQVAFSNWSQGGDNSLSFSFFTNFGFDYIGDPWKWRNSLKFSYGRTKFGDEGFRTNDNEIFFESTLSHKIGWAVSPYAGVSARTTVTEGFNYDEDPALQIVDLFDPLYLTEGVGFAYDKIENFTTRLGIGFKQTFAEKFASIYTDDPDTPAEIEKFKNETGIESITEFTVGFLENMVYVGYFRLFGRFSDLAVWDVRWDNTITAKINNYFNVNLNLLVIYDIDQTLKTQVKEAFQLGISYTVF